MREDKKLLLNEINERLEGSTALLFTRYNSLGPNLSAKFRKQLNSAGGSYYILKKSLLMKAIKEKGLDVSKKMLQGHIGVVIAYDDPISTAKAFYQFANSNASVFEVVGGQFEGQLLSSAEVKRLSELPSKDEMRAQLLGLFEAPMAQTLSVMEALLTSVMHALENKSKASGSAEGAEAQ